MRCHKNLLGFHTKSKDFRNFNTYPKIYPRIINHKYDPTLVDRFMSFSNTSGFSPHFTTDEAPMDRATGGDSDAKALVLAEAPLSDTNLGGLGCHGSRRQRRKNMRKYTGTNHQALPNYIIYITSTNNRMI